MTQARPEPVEGPTIITDEMRAAIGRESEPVTYEVDRTGCRQFARAVGYTDPLYFDVEVARSRGYRDIPAAPGFLGHPVIIPGRPAAAIGPDLRAGFTRILNGGTDVEYLDTVCAGDILTAVTKLVDIKERQGNIGPMLITTRETTFRNADGKVVAVLRGTGIAY